MGDELVCTDKAGTEKWIYKLGGDLKTEGSFMGTPTIHAGGYIIVATFTGDVLTIDEHTGKLVSKYELKHPVRYQPIADKAWIYVTTTTGRLYAINTGNPAITGWNMLEANSSRTNTN
jgi:outer membrane protein assembly factor BamB